MEPWEGRRVEIKEYIEKTVEEIRAGLAESGTGGAMGETVTVTIEFGTRLDGETIVAEKLPQRGLVGKVKFRVPVSIPASHRGPAP